MSAIPERGSSVIAMPTEREMSRINVVSKLVTAYAARNQISPDDLLTLIASLGASLDVILHTRSNPLCDTSDALAPEPKRDVTMDEIRRSITNDALISLLDGKPYKTLKRHLTAHGLDPVTYRAKFGLPDDYPMVAPSYRERRAAIAKGIGLGSHFRGEHKSRRVLSTFEARRGRLA